jgi:hypothetical protein
MFIPDLDPEVKKAPERKLRVLTVSIEKEQICCPMPECPGCDTIMYSKSRVSLEMTTSKCSS